MILTILLFIVILSILVFVHELGHFLTAKRFGMGVDEFGFGFPPRLFGIQRAVKPDGTKRWKIVRGAKTPPETPETKGKTIYSINWIPLGGFVKIKGEQGDHASDSDSFAHKKPWKRAVVLAAGVTMNIFLAFVIISIGFGFGLPSVVDDTLPEQAIVRDQALQIIQVNDGSPADEAGLLTGDVIAAVDGTTYTTVEQFQLHTEPLLGQEMTLQITRGDEALEVSTIPEPLYQEDEGAIGIALAETGLVRYPWYLAIWNGMKGTFFITINILVAFFGIIKNLLVAQPVGVDIAGPVGIAALTGQVAQLGFAYVLQFAAVLSINLAIINAVPFPALDGGRLLFLLIEKIRGKAMNEKVEATFNNVGFMILIGVVLFFTVKDVSRFSDSISSFFSNIF